jgi:hypothetical protein
MGSGIHETEAVQSMEEAAVDVRRALNSRTMLWVHRLSDRAIGGTGSSSGEWSLGVQKVSNVSPAEPT